MHDLPVDDSTVGDSLFTNDLHGKRAWTMRDILHGVNPLSRSVPALPHARQAMDRLRFQLERVIRFRRDMGRRIESQHLLMRLLGSLNVDMSLSDSDYLWAVSDQYPRILSQLKITSPYGPGGVHGPGPLYGDEVHEIWMYTDDPFDAAKARRDWESLIPIRILSHPYNALTLPYLDGSGEGVRGKGIACIVVNGPMLAFQHKVWWETVVRGNPDSPPGLNQFFGAYPLANALGSHLDQTLANRLMAIALDEPIERQDDPNPFLVNFQTDVVDRTLNEALVFLRQKALSYDDTLSAFPQATVSDYHDWLKLPFDFFSTQTEWAAFVARLPLMHFLLAFDSDKGSRYNQGYRNAIAHWVRRMRSGRLAGHGLRGAGLRAVESAIDEQLAPFLTVQG